MRRSKDGKEQQPSIPPTRAAAAGGGGGDSRVKNKKSLEQAYGVTPSEVAKPKNKISVPSSKSSNPVQSSAFGKPTVSVATSKSTNAVGKPTVGATRGGGTLSKATIATNKRGPPTNHTVPQHHQSSIVATSKARYAAQNKATVNSNRTLETSSTAKKLRPGGITQVPSQPVGTLKSTTMKSDSQAKTKSNPPPLPELEPEEENYDDDDFEEDYPSDFEEVDSTDTEDLGHDDEYLAARASAAAVARQIKDRESVEDEEGDDHDEETPALALIDEVSKDQVGTKVEQSEEGEETEEDEESEEEDEMYSALQPVDEPVILKKSVTKLGGGSEVNQYLENKNESRIVPKPRPTTASVKHGFDFVKSGVRSANKERQARGLKLMGMIHLDKFYWELFRLNPSYEQFMYSFTGARRVQQANQTERDVSDVSIQTEIVEESSKWTQKPPTWSTLDLNCDVRLMRQEALGVGSDVLDISEGPKTEQGIDVIKNWTQLSTFVNRASRKMLYILESEKRINLPKAGDKSSAEVKMHRKLSVLNKLEMSCLTCEGDLVACSNGHFPKDKKKHTSKNIITIWSLKEPSSPMYFLRGWGQITTLKIYSFGHIALAGFKDGSISVWDMDEPTQYHSQYQEQLIRTPSVTTSCMDNSHLETVKGLAVIPDGLNSSLVFSIDQIGTVIIWVCRKVKAAVPDEVYARHSSAWSRIHLSLRQTIHLSDELKEPLFISAFAAWKDENSIAEFVVCTNNGFALRGILTDEDFTPMQKYMANMEHSAAITSFDLSIELNVLLTGCMDSQCRLFDFKRRKMILSITCEEIPHTVKWSKKRVSLFYIVMENSIALWDLLVSDITPWKVIRKNGIHGFDLYTTPQKEFTVILQANELKITSVVDEVRPLSSKDQSRIQSYVALLLSCETETD